MTTKTIKTLLFAGLFAALLIPFMGQQEAEATGTDAIVAHTINVGSSGWGYSTQTVTICGEDFTSTAYTYAPNNKIYFVWDGEQSISCPTGNYTFDDFDITMVEDDGGSDSEVSVSHWSVQYVWNTPAVKSTTDVDAGDEIYVEAVWHYN